MKRLKQNISLKLIGIFLVLIAIGWATGVSAYERQSSNKNRVRVDVVPIQLNTGKPAKFEIRMNTHSEDLNFDLVAISTLKDDQGHEYQPLNWRGSSPGGHHRSGVLEFVAISDESKSITLLLKNIAGVPERVFKWEIK